MSLFIFMLNCIRALVRVPNCLYMFCVFLLVFNFFCGFRSLVLAS